MNARRPQSTNIFTVYYNILRNIIVELRDTLDIIYIRYRVHFKIILEYISTINNSEVLDSR